MSQSSIPNSWLSIPIKESFISVSVTNKKLKQKEYKISGSIPVVDQGKDLIGGFTDDNNLKIKIEQPMIIFGDHTKILKFVSFDFAVGADGVKVLKPKKYFLPKLYYYFLHCVKFQDKGYARHFQYLQKEAINLPPYEEQIRIVEKIEELFTKLDTSVTELKNVKKQLKRYRQSVLKSAFDGKLTGIEITEYKNLDCYSDLITKGASPKWQGINYVDDKLATLFVTSENVRDNYIDLTKEKYVEDSFNEKQKRSILKKGDVLFNIVGASIGRAAIFDFDVKANTNQAVSIIRLNKELSQKYLTYFLNSESAKKKYMSWTVDVARANLSLKNVSDIPIPSVSIEEQQKIVEEIESRLMVADKIEEVIDKNLKRTEQLRQSILKKAFKGKLVPQDPNDPPAEKLLERIKKEKVKR